MNTDPTLGHQHHEAVDEVIDKPRLMTQFERIVAHMADGQWRTQYAIAESLGIPQGSVGSQLRNARVDGYTVEKKRDKPAGGTWVYRISVKTSESASASDTNPET